MRFTIYFLCRTSYHNYILSLSISSINISIISNFIILIDCKAVSGAAGLISPIAPLVPPARPGPAQHDLT